MNHELIIHCFDKWWRANKEVSDDWQVLSAPPSVIVSPAVFFHAKIVYDKSTREILKNDSGTSADQIELEVWMLGELPLLDLNRRSVERKRKSYERLNKVKKSFNNVINKKLDTDT